MYVLGVDTSVVDTTQKHALGSIAYVNRGNGVELWMYGKGVASCVEGSWCVFDEAFQAVLCTLNAFGAVGVAGAAIVANTFGWFQIFGKSTTALLLASCADNAGLWTSATAGSLDDTSTSQTLIAGAVNRALVGGSPAASTVSLYYPVATPTTP